MSGRRLGRGTLYHMAARWIFLACDFLVHIYVARVLGPESYGIYGVILALLAIVAQPLNVGLQQSVSRYVAEDSARARAILAAGLRSQVILVAVLVAAFLAFSGSAATLLNSPGLDVYLFDAAWILPGLGILTIFLGMLNGMRRFGREALALSSYPVVRTVAALLLIRLGYGVQGAVWGFLAGALFSAIFARLLLHLPRDHAPFEGGRLRRFAVPVFLLGVVMIVIPNIDLLFVKGMIADEARAGVYNSARVLARSSYFLFLAVGTTIFPSISASVASGDPERTRTYIRQGVRYLLIMSLPVAAVAAGASSDVLSLIFGEAYAGGGPALAILMAGFTLLALFSLQTTILMAGGRGRQAVVAGFFLLPVDALLNLLLIPRYGLSGAAAATSLTALAGVGVASVLVARQFGSAIEARGVGRIVSASAAVWALTAILGPRGPWLLPWAAVALAIYGGLLFLLREFRGDDWVVFRGLLRLAPAGSVEGSKDGT